MTAVEKYFFTPLYYPRSAWSVVRWWEARRPLFNLCVGAAGLMSLGAILVLAYLPPRPMGFFLPWQVVAGYAVLANIGYTMGPVADLLFRRALGDRGAAVAPVLLRYGFVFAVGLTLLPIAMCGFAWLVRLFD